MKRSLFAIALAGVLAISTTGFVSGQSTQNATCQCTQQECLTGQQPKAKKDGKNVAKANKGARKGTIKDGHHGGKGKPGDRNYIVADPAALPQGATDFLATYYPTCTITKCEKDGRSYDLDLADGTDVEFDLQGNLIEVDAPKGAALPADVINGVLPQPAVAKLTSDGVIDQIESIERGRNAGYKVEIIKASPDKYYFSQAGEVITPQRRK
ncbi:MAG: PepSY-like domain-containing protein [Bacteroidales bacterium]|nr:PepSY-like domain-containing protein [Bacteroidales bacterium]